MFHLFKWYASFLCANPNKSIIMRLLTFLLLLPIFISCNAQTNKTLESREITLNGLTKDSVVLFLTTGNDTLDIFREIEIIENDNKDTIILGYSIIPPAFVGKIWFAQINLDKSSAAYLENSKELDPSKPHSYSKLFTIGLWKQNYDRGFKKITLKLKLK